MANPHYEFEPLEFKDEPYRGMGYIPLRFTEPQLVQDTAPLYNDQGMMEANRLKELIGKFQDKPAMVASLQRQLDQVLGAQAAPQATHQAGQVYDSEPDRYAADQGMFDTPAGYTQRAGNADKWANVNPNVKAFLAKKGATSADQIAYDKNQAYLNSVQRYVPQGNDVLVNYDNTDQIKKAGNDVADFDNTINYIPNVSQASNPNNQSPVEFLYDDDYAGLIQEEARKPIAVKQSAPAWYEKMTAQAQSRGQQPTNIDPLEVDALIGLITSNPQQMSDEQLMRAVEVGDMLPYGRDYASMKMNLLAANEEMRRRESAKALSAAKDKNQQYIASRNSKAQNLQNQRGNGTKASWGNY